MWRRKIKTLYLCPPLFIILFLIIAYILSFFSGIYFSTNINEWDLPVESINCVGDKKHDIILSDDFLSHYMKSHGCLKDYFRNQALIYYNNNVIGSKIIPFNSHFIRIAFSGWLFPIEGFPIYSDEEEFARRAYIHMNRKFNE